MDLSKYDNQVEWIKALIDDPDYVDNPLRPALIKLYQYEKKSRLKLKRLMEIADGFGHLHIETLVEDYEKQARRLEKITRISDGYQEDMLALNKQLKKAALYDPLTKLANRRLFIPRLKEEEARCQRSNLKFCLLMLDIDFFKRFNDQYGHEVGDIILCRIAKAISDCLRDYDLCARWGGEEFILLLPNTLMEMAMCIAERIRVAVNSTSLIDIDKNITSSASLGLTMFRPNENYNDTINRSDTALLIAKRSGRNRIEVLE